MARFDQSFLDDISERVALSDIIGKSVTWHRKSRPSAGDFWACCPFHGEKSPSFHVLDKKGIYFCFGCGVSGNHFKFLMEHDGLSFPRAVEEVAAMAGVSMPSAKPLTEEEKAEARRRAAERERRKAQQAAEAEVETKRRVMSAAQIWRETIPAPGTLVQTYQEWRGLAFVDDENIRFHPALERNPERPSGDTHPAMVCRVQDAQGRGCAVWRIYLARDGCGKSPEFENPKLGYGPASGGAVRIGGLARNIGIAEGVETAKAVRELGTSFPVWAALSTSGIVGFTIPPGVERVTVFPDPDGAKRKFKTRRDGSEFISDPPGQEAARKFVEANPGVASIADAAFDADYLEVLQKIKGLPIR